MNLPPHFEFRFWVDGHGLFLHGRMIALVAPLASAEFKRLEHGSATMSYTLALGRADISPEQSLTVSGFKNKIDDTGWFVAKATHSIEPDSGFITHLELEGTQLFMESFQNSN